MLWWGIVTAELRRNWLIKKRYPVDFIFSMAGTLIFLITLVAGATLVMAGRITMVISGPRIWCLALATIAGSALTGGIGYINQHTYAGTLEQVALSPVALPLLVLLRQTTVFVTSLPYLVAYGVGFSLLFPGQLSPGAMFTSVGVTYFGMVGLGWIVTGLAMIFQQVEGVIGFVTMGLYPLSLLVPPKVLATVPWSWWPYGLGLQVSMNALSNPTFLAATPVAWLVTGYAFLAWADGQARRKGVLGLH